MGTAQGLEFGPDGNLYVVSESTTEVIRYNGTSGSFIDVFASGGGLSTPKDLVFGPDGNLYVTSNSNDKVKRYSGTTGTFIDTFVASGSGGLDQPQGLVFGPDDNLYVTSQNSDEILRYEGPFSVDTPPTVNIITPDDNDSYVEGTSITFSGSATDPEDGGISNLIQWTSDDDGLIGIGSSISNSSLSVGSHSITASVTDSYGNTDSHSHPIMVTAPVDELVSGPPIPR